MIFNLSLNLSFVGILLCFGIVLAYGDVQLQGVNVTIDKSQWNFSKTISLSNLTVQNDGITIQPTDFSEPRKYTFFRSGSLQSFELSLNDLSSTLAKFSIDTPGLTDTKLEVTGTKLGSVKFDNSLTDNWSWDGVVNTINSTSTHLIDLFFLPPVLQAAGGGSGGGAPSFNSNFVEKEYPLTINGHSFFLRSFSNKIPTQILEVGNETKVIFRLFDNSGPDMISHFALYTNILGSEIGDSDTSIIYDKGSPLQINDPNGFFSHVNLDTATVGNKLQLTFKIEFAKPMGKSDIIVRSWNERGHSGDIKILGAWQVVNSQGLQKTTGIIQNITTTDIKNNNLITDNKEINLISSIKEWGGYSEKSIDDAQLLKLLGLNGSHIPNWVMKTTKWIVDGQITEHDFTNSINFMYENGIIK